MATNWWRVVTNPSYLTDDKLHAIKEAHRLIVSLTPSNIEAIPTAVTFCQVIGVMYRAWRPLPVRYSYRIRWVNLVDAGSDAIDWSAFGRDHPRNLATLKRATAIARPRPLFESSEGVGGKCVDGQLSEGLRDHLQREANLFLQTHRYFFHHSETDIYLVQVYEKRAWGIRFFVRGWINGVKRTLISVPALAHLSLDLSTIVPSIKRAHSMLEVDEY
ncbi:hypothetical protein FOMPIDRAFT_1055456 [Fomitopsis schrenkii]|uniref:Uncharacterized protein n=1 Tax=Fomitopsis schrenkii TaxID=2126942 RepID=S8DS54_FOMSC|nr:hypothetical protein FOMPIDRAFT_1055456 [Fomitopsis schrenkii]